jgi:hypothetical protein
MLRLLLIDNVVPSSVILIAIMMVAILSSVTSVLTRAKRFKIQGAGIPDEKNFNRGVAIVAKMNLVQLKSKRC